MKQEIVNKIAKELKVKTFQVTRVLELLAEGSTVPFIARYRKEMTGSLDEEQIRLIEKEYHYEENIAKRKEEVIRLIDEKKMLTEELRLEIEKATKLQQVEDLYLPFKEKRKTKATEAIKHGLEPLADLIMTFPELINVEEEGQKYLNDDITSVEMALEGAGYIISERISDTAKYREYTRENALRDGILEVHVKKNGQELDEKNKYEMYYEFSQPVKNIQSYRVLAINRGEKEKILTAKLTVNEGTIIDYLNREVIKSVTSPVVEMVKLYVVDSLKRLIFPSIEREIRKILTEKADLQAIKLFSENLDALIMQPPLKDKMILGVDPAFRTGCKLAVIDVTGNLNKIDVIYPTAPKNDIKGSSEKLSLIFNEFPIDQIVVGNGTASRETEQFLKDYLEQNKLDIALSIVSEAGASVYSASKIAQEEFPNLQVEERSAVSIARRIQDPMAELVKISPKSIGVGQYQHDVNQKELSENLDFVMIKNINKIGVNINTASRELLKYVSGLDKTIAKNIVDYRNEHGQFTNRQDIRNVKRLGEKAFEQAAGFLKIIDGDEPLDQTFIHPESYDIAKEVVTLLELDEQVFGTPEIKEILTDIDTQLLAEDLNVSTIIIEDILKAFIMPNIDMRDELKVATFDKTITKIEDLEQGMELQGQVRNIVDFGAFVDIGLKNDALIHISQISNQFVKSVSDFLKIGDVLTFKIKEVDIKRGKIQLTLLND